MEQPNIYVAIDASKDIKYYEEFKLMLRNNDIKYNLFDGIDYYKEYDKTPDDMLKFKIQKNLERADVIVVLLSKTLKSMRKFSKWQIEHAVNMGKPIIAVNPNRIRSADYDVCPTILKSHLSLHIPYDAKAFEIAVRNWPQSHAEHMKNEKDLRKIYKYAESVYQQIFSEEE